MIYILAQGEGSRWAEGMRYAGEYELPCEYKQMIPVNGEPIIFRTVRILSELGIEDFMIVAKDAMFNSIQLDSLSSKITSLVEPGNTLSGVWQLLKMGEYNVFLLGDVIFSKRVLASVLNHTKNEIALWGRKGKNRFTNKAAGEIFALTVSPEFVPLLKTQLETLKETGTKLWSLYHSDLYSGNFYDTDDWTDDIDSPRGYWEFFAALERCAKDDEERETEDG